MWTSQQQYYTTVITFSNFQKSQVRKKTWRANLKLICLLREIFNAYIRFLCRMDSQIEISWVFWKLTADPEMFSIFRSTTHPRPFSTQLDCFETPSGTEGNQLENFSASVQNYVQDGNNSLVFSPQKLIPKSKISFFQWAKLTMRNIGSLP